MNDHIRDEDFRTERLRARIDVRVLSACSDFASKEETRYYIGGVCLELEPRCTRYVATDGHRLIVYNDDCFDEGSTNTLIGNFIVPTAQCRAFKPKKGLALGEILREELPIPKPLLTIEFEDIGVTFKPIDGVFPDWRRTVPTGTVSGKAGQFNPDYVGSFGKFAEKLGETSVYFAHDGLEKPARVRFGDLPALGVLMPVRKVHADNIPAWLGSLDEQTAA